MDLEIKRLCDFTIQATRLGEKLMLRLK